MTNTAKAPPSAAQPASAASPMLLSRQAGDSLVLQITRSIQSRIDDKLLRTGSRMPSIRQFAELHGVSRFTVVEAYDRLVAQGFLESRRGSGFYVRERAPMTIAGGAARSAELPAQQLAERRRRLADPQHVPPTAAAKDARFRPAAAGLAGRRADRQRLARDQPPERQPAGHLRHSARLPAAAPATATEAGRTRDRRRAGADASPPPASRRRWTWWRATSCSRATPCSSTIRPGS